MVSAFLRAHKHRSLGSNCVIASKPDPFINDQGSKKYGVRYPIAGTYRCCTLTCSLDESADYSHVLALPGH